MSAYLGKIEPGPDFSEDAIRKSIDREVDNLLRKNQSRFEYARSILSSLDPLELPLLHLMDHRVRLPRIARPSDGGPISATCVEDRLNRMLLVTPHPGGRELLGEALKLVPGGDADMLMKILSISPRYFHLLCRGRIGDAIKLLPRVTWGQFGQERAAAVTMTMLIYHCAFQVQLIAARGSAIDRMRLALSSSGREQMAAGAYADFWQTLDAIDAIIKKQAKETSQPPQRALVTDLKPRAEEIRSGIDASDDEIIASVTRYFVDRRGILTQARIRFDKLRKSTEGSLHNEIFGLTSVTTLIFAATRLAQLQSISSSLLTRRPLNLSDMIPFRKKKLPTLTDHSVSKIFFVYRSVILRDSHSEEVRDAAGSAHDLQNLWPDPTCSELYAENAIKDARSAFKPVVAKRTRLERPFAEQLTVAQRADILPDFLLQLWSRSRPKRVEGIPPQQLLLANVIRGNAEQQSRRPRNVYHAKHSRKR